jgi:hypothetical protein
VVHDLNSIRLAVNQLSALSEKVGYEIALRARRAHGPVALETLAQMRNDARDAVMALIEDHGNGMYEAGSELGREQGAQPSTASYPPCARRA